MPKVKISEYSATANSNTDVASINIDEGCAPSGINNAIRAIMGHLKDFQQGTNGDPFNGPVNGTVGATTPSTGAFTTLSATGNVTLGDASTDTLNVGNGGLIKDASGNVGVGFTPSANAGVSTLSIANYNKTFSALTFGSNANSAGYVGYNMGNTSTSNTWKYISADTGSALYFAGNEFRFMQFASGSAGATTNGTQAMTLDASGNLGIANTSMGQKLAVNGGIQTNGSAALGVGFGGGAVISFESPVTRMYFGDGTGYSLVFSKRGSSTTTDLMTLTDSGNLLVGTTGTGGLSTGRFRIEAASGADAIRVRHPDASGGTSATMMLFISTADAAVGSITSNGTSTAYNTSSDYRLKNTIAPMTGALVKLAQLKPVTYKWNADGSDGEGFIAHELAEVVPQCVTGEKDAVDADGKPVYQGIDTSFLVATLTAAIQELKAEFDAYKASHP